MLSSTCTRSCEGLDHVKFSPLSPWHPGPHDLPPFTLLYMISTGEASPFQTLQEQEKPMIEPGVSRTFVITRWLRGLLGPSLEDRAMTLRQQGYASDSIRRSACLRAVRAVAIPTGVCHSGG